MLLNTVLGTLISNHRTYSDSRLYCEHNSGRIRCNSCRAR